MRRRALEGTVYLLHFERPYCHAQHYLGWASDLGRRLDAHRQGAGARLLAVVGDAGIAWRCVRTWPRGTRTLERRLKRLGGHARICPVCSPGRRWGEFARGGGRHRQAA